MILAWTGEEVSYGQTQNGVNFDFEVKFDLQWSRSVPTSKKQKKNKNKTKKKPTTKKTIGILTMVFYTSGPNLVIPAWTGDELSRRQAHDYCRTDGHTDRQTQAKTTPEGQNWPRVKKTSNSRKPSELIFTVHNKNIYSLRDVNNWRKWQLRHWPRKIRTVRLIFQSRTYIRVFRIRIKEMIYHIQAQSMFNRHWSCSPCYLSCSLQ